MRDEKGKNKETVQMYVCENIKKKEKKKSISLYASI